MYDDMPQLVDANGGGGGSGWNFPSSPPPATTHPSAGATPWRGAGVLPGGFGAGTPHPMQRQLSYAPQATPARSHRSFSASPSMGHNAIYPMLAPQAPGVDPFSIPATAFDQAQGYQYPPGSVVYSPASTAFSQPWVAEPPPLSPPRMRQQDPLEGEGGGWSDTWGNWPALGHSPGSGSSSGKGPSPSASVINGFASGPRSQYKRPGDWRPDFTMSKSGALTRMFSLGKGSNGSGYFSKPTLHKILDAKERRCSWDIRKPPEHFLVLPEQKHLDFLLLQEAAMRPEPVRMKIVHPMLPWSIHVSAGAPGSGAIITIGHLVASIHAELTRPIFQSDFWNDEVSEEDRKRIHQAWAARCNGDRAISSQGIKKVDYLCDRWVFEGLRRVGDAWEMKLKCGNRAM